MNFNDMILTPANQWTDPNGEVWNFFKLRGKWYYKRPEHLVSSVAFETKHDAKLDLLRYFQD